MKTDRRAASAESRTYLLEKKFSTVPGPFANDAAAATGGVLVGEVYWKADKLATRLT